MDNLNIYHYQSKWKDSDHITLLAVLNGKPVGTVMVQYGGRNKHPDIDVRTMAAWQSGYKEAIEKACDWLDCYIDNYLFIDAENKSGIKWDDFINDFRKAMKGGEK